MLSAHEVRVTVPGIGWSLIRLDEHGGLGADVDVIGVLLGDVDEDADDVDAVDHVDRRGGAAGRKVGRTAVSRRVARGRQDEIERIGVAGHDHAVIRGGQHEVVDPGLETASPRSRPLSGRLRRP